MGSITHYSTVGRTIPDRPPDEAQAFGPRLHRPTTPRAAEAPLVLVALAHDRLRQPLEKFLRLHGFGVRLVPTAADAIDAIRAERPAAAIVDLGDAPRPGLDVAVAMPLPKPVIMLSAVPRTTRQLARVRPRTRVVGKPCSLILLTEALHEMLASTESLGQGAPPVHAMLSRGAGPRPSSLRA